jgi:ABC-type multidrug transport system fused ATPase/permease subunit
MLVCTAMHISKTLHNTLIEKVMQAPINLFFDVTPIGKLLNRFSRDLSILDESIMFSFGSFLSCFYQALAALFVATIAVPWILIIIFFFLLTITLIFRIALPAYKESYRINMIQMSPILSFFQETMAGNSVIRAFNKETPFTDRMLEMLNQNTLSNEITTAVWSWYSIRVDFLSVIVLASGCCLSVYFKA